MSDVKNVLVIGDIIIDEYVYVESTRKAQEANINVNDIVKTEWRLGGAANVAANIEALSRGDIDVTLAGYVGRHDGELIHTQMNLVGDVNTFCGIMMDYGPTMKKIRYVDNVSGKHLFRVDNFKKYSDVLAKAYTEHFIQLLMIMINYDKMFDAVVFSDYDKGIITKEIIDKINEICDVEFRIVDSKRRDLSLYEGFDILKVNEDEYNVQLARMSIDGTCIEKKFGAVVVTRGERGADVMTYDHTKENGDSFVVDMMRYPVEKSKKVDVTGCGDTHTAAMTVSLLRGGDIHDAAKFANTCASKVVSKFGTSVPDKYSEKILE